MEINYKIIARGQEMCKLNASLNLFNFLVVFAEKIIIFIEEKLSSEQTSCKRLLSQSLVVG